MTLEALSRIRKSARTLFQLETLARVYFETAEGAVTVGDFDAASKAAKDAERLARKLKNPGLATRAKNLAKDIPDLKREMSAVTNAQLTVSVNPEEPEANEVLGIYICFVRNDWESGLACLLKASDGELRLIAARESRSPTTAADRHTLGKEWLSHSKKQRVSLRRRRYEARAAHWFTLALEDAEGLLRARIKKDLEGLNVGSAGEVNLLGMINPARDSVEGKWVVEEKLLKSPDYDNSRLQILYEPPVEYDLRIVVSQHDNDEELILGLVVGKTQVLVIIRKDSAGLLRVDGEDEDENGTKVEADLFKSNRPHAIKVSVRRGRILVAVDGKKLIDWKGKATRLSMDDGWSVPEKRALILGADDTVFHFHEIKLIPISGKGKRLR